MSKKYNKNTTLAFIFPGQGSQSLGMMSDLATAFPVVGETFAEASDALGYDLWQLVQEGPEQELNQTDKTQPAMLTAGVAAWRVWQDQSDVLPAMMAGHSLGEYTALVCSGAIGFADAVALVADRGRFMQQSVPAGTGAMAAILGLDDEQVRTVCAESAQGEVVAAVNFNSPGQVVIAGHAAAVNRAMDAAKAAGAKRALALPVSVPSHCSLMQPAADLMQARLAAIGFNTPNISVINNVDVTSTASADEIRDVLVRQLYQPVRWVETIQSMSASGVNTMIECGPGKVLAGLNKRIDRSINALPLFDPGSLQKALDAIATVGETS